MLRKLFENNTKPSIGEKENIQSSEPGLMQDGKETQDSQNKSSFICGSVPSGKVNFLKSSAASLSANIVGKGGR